MRAHARRWSLLRLRRRVRRVLAVPARWLTHLLMLPADLVLLLWDVFYVNLKKTRIFRSDCRGPVGVGGGPCLPSGKYTNAWLLRLVCRDVVRGRTTAGYLCGARARARICLVRGTATLVLIIAMAAGTIWALINFWPELVPEGERTESIARLVAQRIEKGNALFAKGDHEGALSFFLGALRHEPRNKEIRYRAGLCWAELGEPEKAAQHFREAAEGEGPYAPALNRMALYLYGRGDMAEAGTFAERAVELATADGPTRAVLADRDVWAGALESAAAHLQTAMELDAESGVVRLARAHLLIAKGELDQAQQLLGGAADDTSVTPLAGVYRLELLCRKGRREQALEELEELADDYEELAWPSLLLIDVLFAAGETERALSSADGVEQRFSDSPSVRLQLARVLSKHARDSRALRIALSCDEAPGLTARAHVLAGDIYLRRGLAGLARDHARLALREDPDAVAALLLAGNAALAEGDIEGAARRFRKATEAQPENAMAWNLLGRAQMAAENLEAAQHSFGKACELAPNSGELHQRYGLALMAADRNAEAREEFLRAVELSPRPFDAYARLGVLAQQEGDLEKARDYYVKALEIDPARAFVAANNLADVLLSENKDIPVALALAYSAYVNSRAGPLASETADTLAHALIKAGYPGRAVSVARLAAQARPDSPERLFRLGLAEAGAGNPQKAIDAFERVAQLGPDAEQTARVDELIERLKQRMKAQQKESTSQAEGEN